MRTCARRSPRSADYLRLVRQNRPITAARDSAQAQPAEGLKKLTKGQAADLYKQLVAGLVLATSKEAFALAPSVTNVRIVALRNTPADVYGMVRPEAILAARIARPALNGVQWTTASALTSLDGISSGAASSSGSSARTTGAPTSAAASRTLAALKATAETPARDRVGR